MLIFTRKLEESIIINDNIKITVIDICENRIKIGIEAPKDIPVHRTEVYSKIKKSKEIENFERFTN